MYGSSIFEPDKLKTVSRIKKKKEEDVKGA